MRQSMILAAALAAAGLTVPAFAQEGQGGEPKKPAKQGEKPHGDKAAKQADKARGDKAAKQADKAGGDKQARQAKPMTVTGKVTAIKAVNFDDQPDKHVLAKVELENGKTVVLDLGTVKELRRQKARFRKDQQVSATGKFGRVNQKPVLVVEKIQGDDMTALIIARVPADQRQAGMRRTQDQGRQGRMAAGEGRTGRDGMMQGRRQARSRMYLLQGRLVETRDVQLKGLPEKHRLVKLKLRNGRNVIVDLGATKKIEDINLQKGERVAVVGTLGRVNKTPVVFARQIADVHFIDRAPRSPARKTGRPAEKQSPTAKEKQGGKAADKQQQGGE